MPKTKPEDANLHLNLAHNIAYSIATRCRVLRLAMIGAQTQYDHGDDVAGDVEAMMGEIEEAAYNIAGMIENLPDYRAMMHEEYRRYRVDMDGVVVERPPVVEPAPCA